MTTSGALARDNWSIVQWPTPRSAEWVRQLARDENVSAVIAIGSAARGQARPTSDVDLIIVCKDRTKRCAAPPEVDARWIEVAKLRTAVDRGDDVFAWGIAFGVPLHDADRTWLRLVKERRDQLALPSPAVCLDRSQRARRYAEELLISGDEDAASEQILTMLTHVARHTLSSAGVFPASRPELVEQLKEIGEARVATLLARALKGSLKPRDALDLSASLCRRLVRLAAFATFRR